MEQNYCTYEDIYQRVKRYHGKLYMPLEEEEQKVLTRIVKILKDENLHLYQSVAILEWSKFIVENCLRIAD